MFRLFNHQYRNFGASKTDMSTTTPGQSRIASIDIVRGLVMVIMTLDHVRDYFHQGAMTANPTDLESTTPALFFTRWITHFCAPTFVMLAGASAYLYGFKRGRKELSTFLFTRGLWLVVLEFTLVRFGWTFNIFLNSPFMLQVIWAIGCGMMALSILSWLHRYAILGVGLALVCLHNLADGIHFPPQHGLFPLWAILHEPAPLAYGHTHFFTLYPLLPWLGIMCCGYALGKIYTTGYDVAKRKKTLLWWGLGAVLCFIVARAVNVYGDPMPWETQRSPLYTVLSFINTEKYPPSFLFSAMTLGPALLLLLAVENIRGAFARCFVAIGRVPLFYYVLHLYLAHVLALIMFLLTGGYWSQINHDENPFSGMPPNAGYPLPWVYVAWIAVVLLLYPLCIWYGKIKQKSSWRGWSYL